MKKMNLTRLSYLAAGVTLLLAVIVTSCTNSTAQEKGAYAASFVPSGDDGFKQLELPYGFDALEPYIDAQTMEIHYGKHHAGYTANFNKAVAAEGIKTSDINEIFATVSQYSAAVRNNSGGYYNHSLFWNLMSPDGGGEPQGKLKAELEKSFGTIEEFKKLFSNAAATQFGSGWAWLIINEEGKLQVVSTPNQDNPLMDIATVKGTPILCLDVWEHAYYLKYQNKRADYIGSFWNVVDWKVVEKLYNDAK